MGVIDTQPGKTLYVIYWAGSLILVKLPFWSLKYALPSQRPRPTWTWKRAMIVKLIQEIFSCKVDLWEDEERDLTATIPDSSLTDAKFVWVEGVDDELYCGEIRRLGQITGVRPAKIGGYWYLKKDSEWDSPKAKPGEKTVLFMHGGAFYRGTAHPSDITANFPRGLLQRSQTLQRIFAIEYRLSASAPKPPANPFPAALLDTLAGYRYLVQDAGFAPENIIVAGDSAGGSLAVALTRHLIENPIPSLPPPGRILSASGWFDLAMSRVGPDSSNVLNGPIDIFGAEEPGTIFGEYQVTAYRGALDFEVVKTNRYISPSSLECEPTKGRGLFEGFPETYVAVGGAERGLDESTALIERMRADGVKVVEDVPPDAVHDFVVFTWHDPERVEVLGRMGRWIDAIQTREF
ncbi:alpha/beta-hydrolase [Dichomitus squalens LYAD-421 SS1]|uniref:Alpha/beta-hydrolase n=1 Tax=Dichomitus squalens (strain LYAD-421) TaxID=732165 RepID=R7SRZ6_DICSQ|nr:alpha/beta-hydrolase [Dichomitus squalens LYAD-421 SS1]EJF58703.1 alpha/beta-hydrolase [Dichomitus squalens LYAD-421 SS1]